MVEKTTKKTPKRSKGSIRLHKIPNTELRYFTFRSNIAKLKRMPFVFHNSSRMVVMPFCLVLWVLCLLKLFSSDFLPYIITKN